MRDFTVPKIQYNISSEKFMPWNLLLLLNITLQPQRCHSTSAITTKQRKLSLVTWSSPRITFQRQFYTTTTLSTINQVQTANKTATSSNQFLKLNPIVYDPALCKAHNQFTNTFRESCHHNLKKHGITSTHYHHSCISHITQRGERAWSRNTPRQRK
jgi:hypothetical protein